MKQVLHMLQLPQISCAESVKVEYTIISPSGKRETTVSIPVNGSALDVMKAAVDQAAVDDRCAYKFTATYHASLGFFIDIIGGHGKPDNDQHYWKFSYKKPGGDLVPSEVGVSTFTIPNSGYSIVMEYKATTGTNCTEESKS